MLRKRLCCYTVKEDVGKEWQDGLKMETYTDFASVYDELMDDTPYEEWCEFLMEAFRRYGADSEQTDHAGEKAMDKNLAQERNTVLDLGCGTGTLTELLARRGYDMIGVDNAPEMLQIAMEKRERSGLDILYLLQDMREFELYGTVRAVVSVCDSMNYILEEEELLTVFRLVNNYLDPGGIFIFDMNTVYKYMEELGTQTICENRENASFIWDNYFDEESMINEYDLTLFVEEKEGWYRKYEEFHYQRAYEIETIKGLLAESGMELLAVYGEGTKEAPKPDCGRVYFVAGECEKQNHF